MTERRYTQDELSEAIRAALAQQANEFTPDDAEATADAELETLRAETAAAKKAQASAEEARRRALVRLEAVRAGVPEARLEKLAALVDGDAPDAAAAVAAVLAETPELAGTPGRAELTPLEKAIRDRAARL